jgi:translation elongation factor EF-Ts
MSASADKTKVSPKIGPKKGPGAAPTECECDELVDIVRGLYQKYTDDDYLKTKLAMHIKTTLPNMIQQKCDERNMREERRKTLEETSEEFIREFINSSSYYYNPSIDLFFVYQHNTYKIINEDEIEHDIRTTITDQQNPELSIWKYKIKNSIIKKIKERDLLSSIPESETIQRVLNALTPFIFKNKDSAKYFLTIIGDILLRKNTNTYFIPSKTKHFISDLSEESYALFGTPNMMNHIKFKFYEHTYEECRIIDVVENIISFPFYTHNEGIKIGLSHSMSSSSSLSSLANMVSSSGVSTPKSPSTYNSSTSNIIQKQSMLDLFCVAAHYSTRFNSADLFIEKHCKDHAIRQHAFYLKNITDDEIMTKFISVTMEPCQNTSARITWKNMLYLWKLFVEEEKIPNVFFTNVLKKHLMKRFEWVCEPLQTNVHDTNSTIEQTLPAPTETQETQEVFLNVTSKHLPIVGKFMSFWNENITCNHSEIELEIDELSTLFLNYGNVYHGNQKNVQTITDQTILGFIRHFLPDICIEEDKYLMNIGCKLWDKKQEILACIEEFKKMHMGNGNGTDISITSLKGKHKNKDTSTSASTQTNQTPSITITGLPISFPVHTIYDFYCKWGYKCNKMVVSKRYFEKFFIDNYNEYLTEKNGTLWWNYL